jgi:hypothetical protein
MFELLDNFLQLSTLLAKSLRTCLIAPDLRMFEISINLFETLPLAIEVKDTPSGPDLCPADP